MRITGTAGSARAAGWVAAFIGMARNAAGCAGFDVLHVLFFDVAHQLFPPSQIGFQRARGFHGNDRHLIVSGIAPGNRAARGD